MEQQAEFESRIQAQIELCDYQIKALEARAKKAPELGKQYREQISQLIVRLEALKRGLLEITGEGAFLGEGKGNQARKEY